MGVLSWAAPVFLFNFHGLTIHAAVLSCAVPRFPPPWLPRLQLKCFCIVMGYYRFPSEFRALSLNASVLSWAAPVVLGLPWPPLKLGIVLCSSLLPPLWFPWP